MKAITVSNLRTNLKSYLDQVSQNSEVIVVPRNNKEEDAVVIMSIKEYNSIKETEYLMSSANNKASILEGISEAERGEFITVDLDSL